MRRVLFITSNRLGDAVISSGVLAELMRRSPDARFTVACGPVAASYFEPCPAIERVIVITKQPYDLHWLSLWSRCVLRWWDMVVDLRGSGVSLFLPTLHRRILRGGRRAGSRLSHLAALFPDRPKLETTAWSSNGQEALARQILPDHEMAGHKKYVALAPTANWDGKIWPADRFVLLAQEMERRGLVPVIFYGPGEGEKERARHVLSHLPKAIDLGGQARLGLVVALLARCTLFIGNDSGLMHLAAATGIPTLGLFGPSKASEYAPSGLRARYIEAPGPEGQAPIAGLATQDVIDAACQLLVDEG